MIFVTDFEQLFLAHNLKKMALLVRNTNYSQSNQFPMDKIKSHPVIFLLTILFNSEVDKLGCKQHFM